jgi:hypothetical protein
MKPTKLGLCAAGLAIALCGIPYSRAQTPPVPTNIPNIRAFVAPPATFNPVVASSEELQQYGFPPMPDKVNAPEAYSAWAKAVSAPQTRLESPQLEQTTIYNGPAPIARTIDNKAAARAISISQPGCAKSQTTTKVVRRSGSSRTSIRPRITASATSRTATIYLSHFGGSH